MWRTSKTPKEKMELCQCALLYAILIKHACNTHTHMTRAKCMNNNNDDKRNAGIINAGHYMPHESLTLSFSFSYPFPVCAYVCTMHRYASSLRQVLHEEKGTFTMCLGDCVLQRHAFSASNSFESFSEFSIFFVHSFWQCSQPTNTLFFSLERAQCTQSTTTKSFSLQFCWSRTVKIFTIFAMPSEEKKTRERNPRTRGRRNGSAK